MSVRITSRCAHSMENSEGSYAGCPWALEGLPSHLLHLGCHWGGNHPHSLFSDLFLSLSKAKDIHGQLPAADVVTWHP